LTLPHLSTPAPNWFRDYELPPTEVHAIFPGGPRPSAKVRALVDFLARELG
jgi:DNA-binding transcriptional LysR family regulator